MGIRLVTVLALGALAAADLAGCGSSSGAGPGHTVDAARLDAQISSGLATRLQILAPKVSCPAGRPDVEGTIFFCGTTVDGQALTINAKVAGNNNVNWQPGSAVVSNARTAAAINEKLGSSARCGNQALTVVAVQAAFTCTATVNGQARQVTVTAVDLTGNVNLTLVPASTGPASSTPPITAAPTPGSTSRTLPSD